MPAQRGRLWPNRSELRKFIREQMVFHEVSGVRELVRQLEGQITYAVLDAFLNGRAVTVEERTLIALAARFGVSLKVLTDLTLDVNYGAWKLPDELSQLHPHGRTFVEFLAYILLDAQRRGGINLHVRLPPRPSDDDGETDRHVPLS